MLLSIFSPLYEMLCGVNTTYPEYREQIFGSVGSLTLITAIVIGLLFYVVLGRWKMVWYNNAHWGITILICAILGFLMAFLTAKGILQLTDGYMVRFALFNAVYAAVFFIILSFLFKNFSVFSKRTPI